MRTTRRRLKRKTPFVIFCLLFLTMLAGCCMLVKDIFITPDDPTILSPDIPIRAERLNVLLLGIDARQGETMARTDTMILASVDQKSKQVALLSIPRDTRVNIPKYGMDKINSASVYGGPELSMKVVSDLLGIPVKNYVLVNFSGFEDIVDALGGVTLDVEQDMYHWDEDYEINLKKGVQRLDGNKALQYVRYRDYPLGDIERTQHQQKFLVALGKEMLQPSTIPKLPKLATEINRYVKTNLSATELYTLATASKNLEDGNFITQTLPGRPIDINGGSYWGVDPVEARQMLAKLFKGETETNIVLTTQLSGQYAGSSESKPVTQKTDETTTATVQSDQQSGSQTQQGQNGTKSTGNQKTNKTGQNSTQSGSSGSTGGTVIITPGSAGSTGTGSVPGTTTGTGKTPDNEAGTQSSTGTQSGTGTVTPGKSDTTPGAAPGDEGVNPSIPGAKAKT